VKEWASECEKLNLTIKAEAGLQAMAAHHGVSQPHASPRLQYSPEPFVDTLVDFIITTDQVFLCDLYIFATKLLFLAY
jgi:hypothetical protein